MSWSPGSMRRASARRVSVVEYGHPVVVDGVDDRALRRLVAQSRRWKRRLGLREDPIACSRVQAGGGGKKVRIRARGVLGELQTPDLSVEIVPKFLAETGEPVAHWRVAMWRVLAAVERTPEISSLVRATESSDESPADLMGHVLAGSVERGLLEGLPRGYVERRAALGTLRGRLDLARATELVTEPHRLHCVFESYERDVPVNRLIRWACHVLAGSVLSSTLARRLAQAAATLGSMSIDSRVPSQATIDQVRVPASYRYLAPAVDVAKILARVNQLDPASDADEIHSDQTPGFLWQSHQIFERFVKYLLRKHCRRNGMSFTDASLQLGVRVRGRGRKTLRTFPDARVLRGTTHRFVLDAKYKRWKRGRSHSADDYQVLVGAGLAGCDTGGLVYPSPVQTSPAGKRRRRPVVWKFQGGPKPLYLGALFVDLTQMGLAGGEARLLSWLSEDLSVLERPTTVPSND